MVSGIYLKWSHPIHTTAPLKLHHRWSLSGAQMTFSSSAKANRRRKCSWVQINHKQFCPHPAAYLRESVRRKPATWNQILYKHPERGYAYKACLDPNRAALWIFQIPSVLPLFFIVSVSKDFKYLTQKHFIDTEPLNKIKKDALPVTQSII